MSSQTLQRCDNCLKEFPESKIATHFGYCRRNIKKCTTCGQMYDINFQQEHQEEFHRMETCKYCQKEFAPNEHQKHQDKCDKKPKYCQYCELNVPVLTYPAHLKECESRTKPCTKCNKPIMNKEYLFHIVSCEGPKQEPKPARSYQQHITEQRKAYQRNLPSQPSSQAYSRDKIKPPAYEPPKKEERQYQPQRQYQPEQRYTQQTRVYNYPSRQQIKEEKKRQPVRQPASRNEPKKEEGKRYINSINPPAYPNTHFTYNKKEEYKPSGKIIYGNSHNQPTHGSSDNRRTGLGSRQAPKYGVAREPVSNKDLFPSSTHGVKPSVKESKSIERKYDYGRREEPKRQEKKQNIPVTRITAPEVKAKVLKPDPKPQIEPRHQPDYLHEEYALGAMDLNAQDHELQMAIMQSMGQGSKNSSKNQSTYSFEENELKNPDFIAQQKALEEQLKKQYRR